MPLPLRLLCLGLGLGGARAVRAAPAGGAAAAPHAPTLHRVPLFGRDGAAVDAPLGVLVAEEWSAPPRVGDGGRAVTLSGSSRVFLAADDDFAPATVRSWRDVVYRKLRLRDMSLSFEVRASATERAGRPAHQRRTASLLWRGAPSVCRRARAPSFDRREHARSRMERAACSPCSCAAAWRVRVCCVLQVDLSGVGCGCNAAVYLVAMPSVSPSVRNFLLTSRNLHVTSPCSPCDLAVMHLSTSMPTV